MTAGFKDDLNKILFALRGAAKRCDGLSSYGTTAEDATLLKIGNHFNYLKKSLDDGIEECEALLSYHEACPLCAAPMSMERVGNSGLDRTTQKTCSNRRCSENQ